jgi:hypothetical protein
MIERIANKHGLTAARTAGESSSDAETFWSLFDLNQSISTFKFCGLVFKRLRSNSGTGRHLYDAQYEAETGTCIKIIASVDVLKISGGDILHQFDLGVSDDAIVMSGEASCEWRNDEPDGDEPEVMAKFIKGWIADLAPIIGKDIVNGTPVVTHSRYSTLRQYTNAVLKALREGISVRRAFRVPKDNVAPFSKELEAIMKKYNVELIK